MSLHMPELDAEAVEARFQALDHGYRPARPATALGAPPRMAPEALVRHSLAQKRRVSVRGLFLLPEEEVRAAFAAHDWARTLAPPKEAELDYVLLRMGLFDGLEDWAVYSAPVRLAEMGSQRARAYLVSAATLPGHRQEVEGKAWVAAHEDEAVEACLAVAGQQRATRTRRWLAERAPRVGELLVAGAVRGGREEWLGTLAWYVARFGPPCPVEELEGLGLDDRFHGYDGWREPKKWWPVEGADHPELQNRGPDHPVAIALRDALSEEERVATAHRIVDAFIADKAKPMYRCTLGFALALAPEVMVRRLARQALTWSRSSNRNHRNLAMNVCELFAVVRSEDACAWLVVLAEELGRENHRRTAEWALEAIACDLGRPIEELRELRPTTELGPRATLELDYGPRRFHVRFDAEGALHITDDKGKPRKSLPKPGKKDDPVKAGHAYQTAKELKAEIRMLRTLEARRLARALRDRTEWTLDQLGTDAEHPVRRLMLTSALWSCEAGVFRLDEELQPLGIDDEPVAADGPVRLAHAAEGLDPAWGEVLADYELMPAVPQVGRRVWPVDTDTSAWRAHPGKLVGLLREGWQPWWTSGPMLAGLYLKLADGTVKVDFEPFSTDELQYVEPRALAFTLPEGLPAATVSEVLETFAPG